jgi:hypothetical protein
MAGGPATRRAAGHRPEVTFGTGHAGRRPRTLDRTADRPLKDHRIVHLILALV